MQLQWYIDAQDIDAVRGAVERYANSPLLLDRRTRNLCAQREVVNSERFWRALCMALLTTQQPSGPTSAVSRLLSFRPFPLAVSALTGAADPAARITQTLVEFGGIRRHGKIGHELAANYQTLENGGWPSLIKELQPLSGLADQSTERRAADYLDRTFKGLGPKQARNVLQALGLTRFEIPIDSRIARWLRENSFPVPISASALSDRDYYCFVLDGVQRLCRAADVFPCELDAAVFASYDREDWSPELVRF